MNGSHKNNNCFSKDYFIMIPLFYLIMEDKTNEYKSRREGNLLHQLKKWWKRSSSRKTRTVYEVDDEDDKGEYASKIDPQLGDASTNPTQRIKRIGVQMTSVFGA
jgi:hypothetical protein